ncbi:hypothetical protein GW17_00043562 [Ensete ventricosum]|nr:hypothetical protein GW17_00043562 [Ensete ventricosum]RZS19942.1 hypothetical protein BHM03_00052398 [Ensete ventricosum]
MQGAAARRVSSPQVAATRGRGRGQLWPARKGGYQRPARKGQPLAISPQEAAHGAPARGCPRRTRKGLPTAHPQGAATSRGGDAVARVATPWQGGCRPQCATPPPAQGQRRRWQRRRVKERVRASF